MQTGIDEIKAMLLAPRASQVKRPAEKFGDGERSLTPPTALGSHPFGATGVWGYVCLPCFISSGGSLVFVLGRPFILALRLLPLFAWQSSIPPPFLTKNGM